MLAYSTKKIRDAETTPTKLEQTNEIPPNQFLPKNFFNCVHTEKTMSSRDSNPGA